MKVNVTVDFDDNAVDIPTMREMSAQEYEGYVHNGLFFVDHHEILRAVLGEYPIATTPEQIEHLINYLKGVSARMRRTD